MKKSVLLLLILALSITLTIILSGCTSPKTNGQNEVVIGFNNDQTSVGTGVYGVNARYGFEVAVNEINAQGGILGKQIKAVILDDKANPNISTQNMQQLIFQDKAVAVVGPANSANAFVWMPLAQDNEVTVIIPIATATELTTMYKNRPRNYIFRLNSLDNDAATLSVAWLIEKTNNGKVAIIYDSTPYGTKGLKDVSDVLARWGKTPVFTKSFDRGTSIANLTTIIESAKADGADGIYFFCYPDSTADLLKALDNVTGYNPVVVTTPAGTSPILWQLAGNSSTKLAYVAGVTFEKNARNLALWGKINQTFGVYPPTVPSSAANAYDAVILLKAAMEKAGTTTDKVAIRDALENVQNVQGVIKFYDKPFSKENHEGVTINEMWMAHWVNGTLTEYPDGAPSNIEIR
jgi:branched-chain amino acid transport system substrate-binding protein